MIDIDHWLAMQGDSDDEDEHEDLEPPEDDDPLFAIYAESEDDEHEPPLYARRILAWGEDSGRAYVQVKLSDGSYALTIASDLPNFFEMCYTEEDRVRHYEAPLMDEPPERP